VAGQQGRHRRRPARWSKRRQIWQTLRILREEITKQQVAAITGLPYPTVQNYVAYLERAGYVRRLPGRGKAGAGPGPVRFRLVRDTGPHAPIASRDGRVYDPNLDAVMTA
jgi:DNA-binding transcriptional ArsR family regulator